MEYQTPLTYAEPDSVEYHDLYPNSIFYSIQRRAYADGSGDGHNIATFSDDRNVRSPLAS